VAMLSFTCAHHDRTEETNAEVSGFYCGCDGSVHLACRPVQAPHGNPRAAGWPQFLSWPRGNARAYRAYTAAWRPGAGHLVAVDADVSGGPPSTVLTGLPGQAVKTTADRVRAAIVNGGFTWPDSSLAVNLRPAAEGGNAGCDLGIAVAVLAATGAVPYPAPPEDMMFFAELGLDGRLRPVPSGTAEAAACAAAAGMRAMLVAEEDAAVTAMGPVRAVAAGSLAEVPDLIRNLREDRRAS
jgi:hypothetical protein